MGNIVLLDELTINKIAAGEVIERPASVIKEMVENSIDAGATNITVEIKNGGISYIRITDNGKGIAEDDMEIAFERHATSKIRSAEDLNTVMSMGFRGEALASIAAISRVEMVSKTAEQANGYKIVVEGGNILEEVETGCAQGTTITVSNLFYNTPVRYKFLKKDFTEAGYIEDVITRIALVHPEIAIKLISNGKTIIQTNGNGDIKTVIYSIYGKDVAGGLIETEYTYEGIHVYGVIGKPEIARSNRANQIFFVNQRYVRDKSLTSAAEKAYKGMIPIGKFSFLVLNVDMNPGNVDVNVHPAKLEVRFEDENSVFKAVYHAIKDSLLKAELVADTEQTTSEKRTESGLFGNKPTAAETIVEQVYRARQQLENKIAERKKMMEEMEKTNQQENLQMIENKQEENLPILKEEDSVNKPMVQMENIENVPEIEKSQEVLRKLQEMKEKLIQETPEIIEEIKYGESETEEKSVQVNEQEKTYEYEVEKSQETEPKQQNEKEEIQEENPVVEKKIDLLEEIAKANQKKIDLKEEIEKALDKNEEEIISESQMVNNQEEKIQEEQPKVEKQEYTKEFEEMYLKLFGKKPVKGEYDVGLDSLKKDENIDDIASLGNVSVFDNIEEYKKPTYKFIGIVFNT